MEYLEVRASLIVPEVILDASKPFSVLLIDTLLDPSNVALPDTAPAIAITLGVANLVAVPALPLTVVCAGCLWSSRAYFVDVPTAAVPAISGATVAGLIFPALTKASTSEALISHLYSLPQVQIIGPSSINDIYASNTLRSSVPAVVFALSAL